MEHYSSLLTQWRAKPENLFERIKHLSVEHHGDCHKVANNLIPLPTSDDIIVVTSIQLSSAVDEADATINSLFPLFRHEPQAENPEESKNSASNKSGLSSTNKEENKRIEEARPKSARRERGCPVISKIICRLEILDEAIGEFAHGELIQGLIQKFVLGQTLRAIQTLREQNEYNLMDVIKINDEFGNWTFDVLFGMLRIVLCLPDASTFPSQWRLDQTSSIEVDVMKEVKKEEESPSLALPSLADWLEDVCERTDMTQFYRVWLTVLERTANVTTLQHLLDWKVETWDKLTIAPNAKAILSEAVSQFKSHETSNSSTKGKATASPAEIESRVHRIKLFFYYHTGTVYYNQF
jgi:hypothetical protein